MEIKFLAYVLNVKRSFEMRIISYANNSLFHIGVTVALGNGLQYRTLLRRRMHMVVQGRKRKSFRDSKESFALCS